jgi:excisionase family DNA binding protein
LHPDAGKFPRTTAAMIEPRLSVKQLADAWGCSRQHVYSLVQGGQVNCLRIGDMIRFRPEDIRAYEARCQDQNQSGQPTPSQNEPTLEASSTFNGGKVAVHDGYHAALRTRAKRAAS